MREGIRWKKSEMPESKRLFSMDPFPKYLECARPSTTGPLDGNPSGLLTLSFAPLYNWVKVDTIGQKWTQTDKSGQN